MEIDEDFYIPYENDLGLTRVANFYKKNNSNLEINPELLKLLKPLNEYLWVFTLYTGYSFEPCVVLKFITESDSFFINVYQNRAAFSSNRYYIGSLDVYDEDSTLFYLERFIERLIKLL